MMKIVKGTLFFVSYYDEGILLVTLFLIYSSALRRRICWVSTACFVVLLSKADAAR